MKPAVNAKLVNKAYVGDIMEVNIQVTNLDNSKVTYAIGLEGYNSEIAEFIAFSTNSVTLEVGETAIVTARFRPILAGEFTFDVSFTSLLGEKFNQPVSLTVYEEEGFTFDFNDNMVLYLLAGVLLVFIILLFVLISVASRKRRKVLA